MQKERLSSRDVLSIIIEDNGTRYELAGFKSANFFCTIKFIFSATKRIVKDSYIQIVDYKEKIFYYK